MTLLLSYLPAAFEAGNMGPVQWQTQLYQLGAAGSKYQESLRRQTVSCYRLVLVDEEMRPLSSPLLCQLRILEYASELVLCKASRDPLREGFNEYIAR